MTYRNANIPQSLNASTRFSGSLALAKTEALRAWYRDARFPSPHREIQFLTSRCFPAIKVDVMEIDSMTSLLQPDAAAPLTTAIARMFGKTVKFRHCPATVSAPVSLLVAI